MNDNKPLNDAKAAGTATGRSPPVLSILGAVLVVLKATNVTALPWLWVLTPFWGPLALLTGFLAVVAIGCSALLLGALIIDGVAGLFRTYRTIR
jgi:hypothetical protein